MGSDILLRKRYGNQWFRVNALIQPDDWMVEQIAHQLRATSVHGTWDWVITHIRYPWGQLGWSDTHTMQAFWLPSLWGKRPQVRYTQADFWSMPGEVLRDRTGDCKDSAALLTSLLRHSLSERQVYMSVGLYVGQGRRHLHAWTTIFLPDGTPLALDTTYPRPLPPAVWVTEQPHYIPFWRANDQRSLILKPQLARHYYGGDLRLIQASASPSVRCYAHAER